MSILVLGAGMSGLAGALTLARAGKRVVILEARPRAGGRVLTVESQPEAVPVELGAEFVHGDQNATWPFIREAGLDAVQIPDRHWELHEGWRESPGFWDALEQVFGDISAQQPDRSFHEYLASHPRLPSQAVTLAVSYVEGFHAADPNRIGTHALALAEQASEREGGTRQFRITSGYSALVRWFEQELRRLGAEFVFGFQTSELVWRQQSVEARPEVGDSRTGSAAILTLPLPVLERFVFRPQIPAKETSAGQLASGHVTRVTMKLKDRSWPNPDFGFLHVPDLVFPTWWSHLHRGLITAWTGGPKSKVLNQQSEEDILREAFQAAQTVLGRGNKSGQIAEGFTHNWSQDRHSRLAYSYTPAGAMDAPAELGKPVAGTLFFAGEATDADGNQGTVHGAIASGIRAAHQLLDAAS